MITKTAFYAFAFGSLFGCATAFAQEAPAAASPPAAQPTSASANDSASPASGDGAIHLHMPVHHRAKVTAEQTESSPPAENPTVDAIGADTTAPPPTTSSIVETPAAPSPQPPAPAKPAKTSRKTEQQPAATIPFSFGEDTESAPPPPSPPQKNSGSQTSLTRETKTASLPTKPAVEKGPATLAKPAATPARTKSDEHAGLTKRGAVLFDKGTTDPSPAQFKGVKLLAGDLSTALEGGASRVQLEAYAGAPGDKSSDSRRLSLKRALAVRQLLIDDGIPSNRIDLRAMGGVGDGGPDDRVDVFVRAS